MASSMTTMRTFGLTRVSRPDRGKAAAAVVLAALLACGDAQDVTVPEPPRAASLSISPAAVTLAAPGETVEVAPTVLDQHGDPFPASFTWTSDDVSVATVDQNGVVTAVSPGTATITVVSGELSAAAQASVDASSSAGVCDRTPQVRDVLVSLLGRSDCSRVSAGLLARVRRLDLSARVRRLDLSWTNLNAGSASAPANDCEIADAHERRGRASEGCRPRASDAGVVFHDMGGAPGAERITTLRNGDFQGLNGLQFLDLSGNYLRGLPDSVFAGLARLDTLHLQGNLLAALPAGVFGALTGLERLDLSGNVLTALPDSSFKGFTELGTLNLNSNWLTALPGGIFDSLAALDTLGLGDNELATLPDGVFDGLSELELLNLSGNRLSELPDSAFHDLTGLEYLTLSGNRLTGLPAGVFDRLGPLTRLFMTNNRLAALPEAVFDSLPNLRVLFLGQNRLAELPDGVFANLASLDTLTVTRNRLSELPEGVFDGLADLDYLSFSFNKLTELPDGLLDNLGDLATLYMSGNDLTRLPTGVFDATPRLEVLSIYNNALTELPRGVFAGLASLDLLWLDGNTVDPFPLTVEAVRTDNANPLAEGPAQVRIAVREGAPFEMRMVLGARGSQPASTVVTAAAGDTLSRAVTVRRREGSVFQYVVADSLPPTPEDDCDGFPCFDGIDPVAGNPLVLANPPSLKVEAQAAYLVQAAQSWAGRVPLVADREALLRVFVTADYVNAYRPPARATFFLDDEELHVAALNPPVGLPGRPDESSMERSYNAMIPDSVMRPGVEMVVEIDPDGTLSTTAGSQLRIPATGRRALDIRRQPSLDVALVPVAFGSSASAADNEMVAALVRDMAGADSRGAMGPSRALLPVAELNLRAREPYVSWTDTLDGGGIELLDEINLLRHIEAAATNEYYHGIFAHPATRFPWDWEFGGVAYVGWWAGLSLSHMGGVYRGDPFAQVVAHELGHNLSLRHTPCGNPGGVDQDYPYAEASTGIWGVDFSTGGEFGRPLSPAKYKDYMSYCGPEWTSDYSFAKAFEHRLELPPPPAPVTADGGRTLLLWGGVRADGELRLEPVFEWDAPVKLPASTGPYRLTGLGTDGERLFSMSFAPDEIDHGGRGFLFAVPAGDGLAENLESVTLTGPEGLVSRDRDGGGATGGAIVTSRATGRVLSIVRDWSAVRPEALGGPGAVAVSRSVLAREVRERGG